jgi:integrase/recombinase XerD
MKAKIALLARVGGSFVNIKFHKSGALKGEPISPEGATLYYARFRENGKRIRKLLGGDFTNAVILFRNMEVAKDFRDHKLPVGFSLIQAPAGEAPVMALLSDMIESYCAENEKRKARKTFLAYRNSLVMFGKSCLVRFVSEVKRDHVMKFLDDLNAKGFHPRTVYNNFLNVMVFLKWAGNPGSEMKPPVVLADWPEKAERKPSAYTNEEIAGLLKATDTEGQLILNCFLWTGIRSGELTHLTYGDIDFKHSAWSIDSKLDWKTKTKESKREVPAPPELTKQLKTRMVAGRRSNEDLIFPNGKGKPDGHIIRIVKSAAKKAGVTGRVDDHKFRATAITRWLRSGKSIPDVMMWVGHRDPATIMRYAESINVRKAAAGMSMQESASGD